MTETVNTVVQALQQRYGPIAVLVGEDVLQRPVSKQIASGCAAAALLRPRDTAELAEMVGMCARSGVALVPRAGMTGLVGGTVTRPQEIALSLERMRGVESVDTAAQTLTVLAGTPLQEVQDAALAHGLQLPLDLGARGSATIGGMLATNAGGNKVLRYGMARELVLGLEVVLPDGSVMDSMFSVLKNNTGLDVKQLFIGSEGTLGIITRAVLRLFPRSGISQTALCAFASFDAMVATLNLVRRHAGAALTSFEAMWSSYYRLVTEPGRLRAPLSDQHPLYALVECEYPEGMAMTAQATFGAMLEEAMERGDVVDAVVAQSETERSALWSIRDEVHYIRTLSPIASYDVSLPIVHMPGYLAELEAALRQRWPDGRFICYGHIGDGNLHLAISCGTSADAADVDHVVYAGLGPCGGSISAEHGVGLYKRPYLHYTRNDVERSVMQRVKAALDPANLLNPGKIL
jgi:FAD/FMN-containing dehydrogenase